MKKLADLTILVLLVVGYASGQASQKQNSQPDFSGTWMFNTSASKIHGFVDDAKKAPLLEVTHADPVFKAVFKSEKGDKFDELIFYTDSRGEVNLITKDGKPESVTSKTKWDGKKLVRKLAELKRKYSQKQTKEEWFLSPEGKTLTRKITITSKYTIAYQVNGKETGSETTTDKVELLFVFDKIKTEIG